MSPAWGEVRWVGPELPSCTAGAGAMRGGPGAWGPPKRSRGDRKRRGKGAAPTGSCVPRSGCTSKGDSAGRVGGGWQGRAPKVKGPGSSGRPPALALGPLRPVPWARCCHHPLSTSHWSIRHFSSSRHLNRVIRRQKLACGRAESSGQRGEVPASTGHSQHTAMPATCWGLGFLALKFQQICVWRVMRWG